MEDCRTPTLAQVVDFKYERSPTMVFDANRLQEAQNLFVNRTNFYVNAHSTPVTDNFLSPGMSNFAEMAKMSVMESGVQKPIVSMEKKDRYKSPTTMPLTQQQFVQQQQQQQLKKQNRIAQSAHFSSDSPVFVLNSTAIADKECSLEVTSPCLLDRTMNVTTLLRSVGLEQYAEMFCTFNFQQFLRITAKELKRCGVRSRKHRRIILELLSKINGALSVG